VEKAGLKNKLKKINKACDQYRVVRNGVVHHDKYVDEELEWVDTARKAKFLLRGNIESIEITDEQILSNTAVVINKHLKDFQSNSENITTEVNSLLDQAKELYDRQSEQT